MKVTRRSMAGLAAVALAACGDRPKPVAEKPNPAAEKPVPQAQPVEYFHVEASTAATLGGRVSFHGVPPKPRLISMDSDAGCPQTPYEEHVVTGKGGGLANAFVYIQSGLEGKHFEPAKEAVRLDQHGCMFVPRIIGIRAGQVLEVKNSDRVSHNIHPLPRNNYEWNQQQSPESPDLEHKFPRPEIMIRVKCNVHSWMRAYVGVVDHPYFAVTGPDGHFELKKLPPGDYIVAAWHEDLGELKQPVHVAPSGSSAVNFSYP